MFLGPFTVCMGGEGEGNKWMDGWMDFEGNMCFSLLLFFITLTY